MDGARQGPGRPRDRRIDRSVVRATTELLDEAGYSGLTVDAVAARAGVSKAAIYRRYASKQELVFSVAVRGIDEDPPADAGALGADLKALCRHLSGRLASTPSDVLSLLLADIYADPSLAERFTATHLHRERRAVTEVLQRAVARGELVEVPDPAVVHALLTGPVFAWLLVLSEDPARLLDVADIAAEATAGMLLTVPPR